MIESERKAAVSPETLSPLVWAYVGDAVYELYVRTRLTMERPLTVRRLHREAVRRVRASAQVEALEKLRTVLTPEEEEIVRRGRNAKGRSAPASSDVAEYRTSTGFEALIGYLYLQGEKARVEALMRRALGEEEGGDSDGGSA